MMFSTIIKRFFHSSKSLWVAEQKSLLAALRKKTGYTFSNCKKALELHNNDIAQAEKWLKDQAQAMGWSKATKLEGRQTSQGLVAVSIKGNTGVMVELNCETDFVARNKNFQEMAEKAASACFLFASKSQCQSPLTKIALDHDQLRNLQTTDGKTLADHLALMIGTVGENASLRRAICFKSDPDILLSGYTHPAVPDQTEPTTIVGKFGAILAYRSQTRDENIEILGKKLCQHVVGMAPEKIGSNSDEAVANSDEEKCLINQDYILDESLKVKEVLEENGIQVVDFKRFECGEQEGSNKPQIEQNVVEEKMAAKNQ